MVFSSNSLFYSYYKKASWLGLLHSFIARNHQDLVPVLPNLVNIKREYWLVVHENLYNLQKIKAVTSFLGEILKLEKIILNN